MPVTTRRAMIRIRDKVFGEGKPKICLPVIDTTDEDILRTVETYERLSDWDVLEVRLDHYEGTLLGDATDLLMKIREKTSRLILATLRTKDEGGQMIIDDDHYGLTLSSIITARAADLVDIESSRDHTVVLSLTDLCRENDVKSIISKHYFNETPSNDDMREIMEEMNVLDGDILKLAVMPQETSDVMRLMKVTSEMSYRLDTPLITMSMGDLGKLSRISGEITGSVMTFGSYGEKSASGQITLSKLQDILEELHCD